MDVYIYLYTIYIYISIYIYIHIHGGRKNWKGRVSYMQLVSLHIFYRAPGAPAMGNGSYSCIDERRGR